MAIRLTAFPVDCNWALRIRVDRISSRPSPGSTGCDGDDVQGRPSHLSIQLRQVGAKREQKNDSRRIEIDADNRLLFFKILSAIMWQLVYLDFQTKPLKFTASLFIFLHCILRFYKRNRSSARNPLIPTSVADQSPSRNSNTNRVRSFFS